MKIDEIMMLVMEECGEVIQAIAKVKRFGMDGGVPDRAGQSNKEDLIKEGCDLFCVLDMMMDELGVEEELIFDYVEKKKKKIQKWTRDHADT